MPKRAVKKNPLPFAYSKIYLDGGEVYVRNVSDMIPDDIIATGNVRKLQDFYETNKDKLSLEDLRYLQARLETAWKLEELEMEAKTAIERGEAPKRPEVTNEQGYIGLANLKLEEPQTSGNGCWSCGMHLLLKSRGIDLSQEEIRAYRPDFQPGQENLMSEERRMINDSDSTNYVFDKGDLIQKVLPNTAITNVQLNPAPLDVVVYGGPQPPVHPSNDPNFNSLSLGEQQTKLAQYEQQSLKYQNDARKVYYQQVRKQMSDMIHTALTVDRSPVVVNLNGGHFITITGISEDGTRVRVQDSFGSSVSQSDYRSLDTLISTYLQPGTNGMTLTWLKDLPIPEYVPVEAGKDPKQPDPQRKQQLEQKLAEAEQSSGLPLFKDSKDAIHIQEDGSLKIQDVMGTDIIANADAKPDLGQLNGQTISNSLDLDQEEMKKSLGGGILKHNVVRLHDKEAHVFLGDQQYYYPKKLLLKGDPALKKDPGFDAIRQKREELARDLETRIQAKHLDKVFNEKTFGLELYEVKQQLYLKAEDTVLHLSKLYALNQVMSGKKSMSQEEKDEQVIDNNSRNLIDHYTQKAIPVIRTLLEKSKGTMDLSVLACNETETFMDMVDNFVNSRERGANPDMIERRDVIASAFTAMRDTGTGRNYFGKVRKENSPEYEEMLQGIIDYGKQLGPNARINGFENHIVIQKCLNYIQDKMKVRSTTTGQIRFDNTMRILAQVMPGEEFQKLCDRVNRARGVAAKPKSKDHVSRFTYLPKTPERIAQARVEALKEAPEKLDMVKELSEILAMCEIARERNPQRKGKTELMAPGHEEEDRLIIEDRAAKIRQQAGFQTTVERCPADPDACLKVLKNYVDDLSANKIDPKQLINGTQPQINQPIL
jgi:hypothetical protein